jgi:hypothetical protein
MCETREEADYEAFIQWIDEKGIDVSTEDKHDEAYEHFYDALFEARRTEEEDVAYWNDEIIEAIRREEQEALADW